MMGKAHMGVGVAAALALLRPTTPVACAAVVMGASLGSVVCDVDVRPNERAKDAFRWRMVALVLACALLAYDYLHAGPVCAYLKGHVAREVASGIVGMIATTVLAALTSHRTFSHSLVALALWGESMKLLCEPLAVPFVVGIASHVLLDLTNKKGIRLFWPLRNDFSLGLWKADGLANDLFALVGMVASVVLLAFFATGRHGL